MAVLCSAALIPILNPHLVENIWFAVQTINFTSGVGLEYTGSERVAQIVNIIHNLNEVPLTWLSGYGIGTRWFVFEPLPTTTDTVGSFMAFDANVQSTGTDWLPSSTFLTFQRFLDLDLLLFRYSCDYVYGLSTIYEIDCWNAKFHPGKGWKDDSGGFTYTLLDDCARER